ncbi:MAG: hypothetical protein WDO72_19895 [Pseudomonadota bacterium]
MRLSTAFVDMDEEEQNTVLDQELWSVAHRQDLIDHKLHSIEKMNRLHRAVQGRITRMREKCPSALGDDFDKLLGNLRQLNEAYPRRIALGHFKRARHQNTAPLMDVDLGSISRDGTRLLLMEWKRPNENANQEWLLKKMAAGKRGLEGVSVWLVRSPYFGSNPKSRPPEVTEVTDMATGTAVLVPGTVEPVIDYRGLRAAFWFWYTAGADNSY